MTNDTIAAPSLEAASDAEPTTGRSRPRAHTARAPRVAARLPMTIAQAVDGPRVAAAVLNLGAGGVFAQCATLFPVGTALWVSLAVPTASGRLVITTAAWVRWVNDPASPKAAALPAGMGMEFLGLDEETGAGLRACVDARLAAGGTVH